MQEAVAANEEAILERRYEIRTSLRAVENSLREAGAATDGYNSAYWLESPSAHWDNLSSSSMFYRQAEHVSKATLARSATHRFGFDAPDAVRYHWRLTPLSEAKCRQIWSLFDADKDEKWTHEEFREYMVALQCSKDSVELRAFEDSAEVWRMYMNDMCELVEEGKLTFEGFKMYRELIEDEQPLVRDLAVLGISLEWEELERMETIKQRFDGYVDDPMEAAVDTDETFSGSGSDASEHDDSDNDDKQSECEEAQEEVATIDTEEKEHNLSGPTTIQDKYKLPPMEWKATTSAVVNGNLNEGRRSKENAQEGVSTSKVSRVDYNERVTSVMQRVETLSGVMKLMRTSFQLFSTDKYDPDHPDADWGGYVRRSYKKRFYTNQSGAKDSLTYDEKGGIMPRDEADKSTISGKKLFEPQQNLSGEQVAGIPFQSSVYQVGPGGNVSSNDWKTLVKAAIKLMITC
ncbi:hypothetical protein JG687_00004828 [Phytophthora cactorum]|uniref:EF-hand domain-containing protein n=1 Tax=Phytophthora cactorum TaxID=29920 RepID=A0A8T1UQ09_9STRA|nr:hypothetical protein JG687_00004828 [Phytophthora cactorum]